jgi:hypothetical protein
MRAHGRRQGLKRTTRRTGFLDVNQKSKSAPGREIASPTPAVRIALKWQPLPEGTPISTTTGLGSNSIRLTGFEVEWTSQIAAVTAQEGPAGVGITTSAIKVPPDRAAK